MYVCACVCVCMCVCACVCVHVCVCVCSAISSTYWLAMDLKVLTDVGVEHSGTLLTYPWLLASLSSILLMSGKLATPLGGASLLSSSASCFMEDSSLSSRVMLS